MNSPAFLRDALRLLAGPYHHDVPAHTEQSDARPTLRLRDNAVSWTPTDEGLVVVLDLRSSRYLNLNSTGAGLWELLADGTTRADLESHLQATYQLASDQAAQDVAAFLADLRERDLLDAP